MDAEIAAISSKDRTRSGSIRIEKLSSIFAIPNTNSGGSFAPNAGILSMLVADILRTSLTESTQAVKDMEKCLLGQGTDHLKELNYYDRKAIHNLKYFTWVEQQAKEIDDLNQLWYDRTIWDNMLQQANKWDEMINEFNEATGVLKSL